MAYDVYISFDEDENIKFKNILWVHNPVANKVCFYVFNSKTWRESNLNLFKLQQNLTKVGSVLEKDQALSIYRMYELTES